MSNNDIEVYDETSGSKFVRKAKESPFMIAGITGMLAVLGIGAYKFKNKGDMATSVFLMQLRVTAQSAVIGSLTIGLAFQMFQEYVLHRKTE